MRSELSIKPSTDDVDSDLHGSISQVRRLPQLHSATISSLCFSQEEEHLAASSEDGSVAIVDLFTSDPPTASQPSHLRFLHKRPITSLSLDPRFSSRKTKEYVIGLSPLSPRLIPGASNLGPDQGSQVLLCGSGWLGRSETLLHQEPPSTPSSSPYPSNQVHVVRWAKSIIVWGTDKSVFAYDTHSHLKIRTINRYPASQRQSKKEIYQHIDEKNGGVSILFGPSDDLLYVGWKDCVKVARVLTSENNVGGLSFQIEVTHEIKLDPNLLVLGVAPFGRDLAVLVFNDSQVPPQGHEDQSQDPPASSPSVSGSIGSHELRVLSLSSSRHEALAQDLLPVKVKGGVREGWRSRDFTLVPPPPVFSSTALKQKDSSRRTMGGIEQSPSPPPSPFPSAQQGDDDNEAVTSQEEPSMFFIVSPGGILVSKSRDLDDRVSWLLEQKRYEEALRTTERAERGLLSPNTHEVVVEAYIEDLLEREAYQEAAELSLRLLRDDRNMWERWTLLFAQTRQLVSLAPFIPIEPRLSLASYEMVLFALLGDPGAHGLLLDLVINKWPASFISSGPLGLSLTRAVEARVQKDKEGGPGHMIVSSLSTIPTTFPRPSSQHTAPPSLPPGEPLYSLLCELHLRQGRPDLSLGILIGLRSLEVFDFIETHSLYSEVVKGGGGSGPQGGATAKGHKNKHGEITPAFAYSPAALLLAIDEAEALKLLTRNVDSLPPSTIVPGIRSAIDRASSHSDSEVWRKRLYHYLQSILDQDSGAAVEFHELQVQLTAEFAPHRLMNLLHASHSVPLESALAICQRKGLVSEQVYLLNRMGNSRQALNLIIEKLKDVPRAIEFVRESRDEELWDHLMTWALRSSETTGSLMDHAGGAINPLSLIRRLPRGLHVPRLRDRIRAIVSDFRTQSCLHEGCRAILDSDCIRLVTRLYREARSCARKVYVLGPSSSWQLYDSVSGRFDPLAQGQNLTCLTMIQGEDLNLPGMRVIHDMPTTGGAEDGEDPSPALGHEEKAQSKAAARKASKKGHKDEVTMTQAPLPSLVH